MSNHFESFDSTLDPVPTKQILEFFKGLKAGTVPRYKGICKSFQEYLNTLDPCTYVAFDVACRWLYPHFRTWSKFSGGDSYPVPGPAKRSAYRTYANTMADKMWTGAYGALRLELVDHIIAQLELKLATKPKKFRAPDISFTSHYGATYKGRADAVLKRLEAIQARQKAPLRNVASKHGICNIYSYLPGSPDSDVLRTLFKTWPKHSGNGTYPVPSTTGQHPSHAYDIEPRWVGKAGKLRRELLQHCIDECKRRINEARVKQGFPTIT